MESHVDFEFFLKVHIFTVPLIIGQFVRKRCQKKREDVKYQLLGEFFQKYFVVNKLWAGKNSFRTYVFCTLDVLFWCQLYLESGTRP